MKGTPSRKLRAIVNGTWAIVAVTLLSGPLGVDPNITWSAIAAIGTLSGGVAVGQAIIDGKEKKP